MVRDIQTAIQHINTYGSHHSDAIVASAQHPPRQALLKEVDSAAVYATARRASPTAAISMGAEMGISTDKLHARGPMGLEELTTYKYVVWPATAKPVEMV